MEQMANAEQRKVVLTRAVAQAAARLGMKQSELARALGLSPATISRMYAGDYFLDERTKHWEIAALLVRLYRGLDAITAGDERSLRAWMHNPNTDLHDVPGDLVSNVAGLARVVEYVDAHRARI
ncbi:MULTISPECIES: antitoxin Xre/MbcA/ParS toxin-binding domain-containing protein [unclassified Thioalkalivibrio]|uniref:antitoxin Xre/MbcA/ParS toxin-binding domain-containing protein n=1 Tax=unclassified Thioalkalivibrio TaxID=2621013 RepID=UPI0003A86A55|nr:MULTISPECIES: antitoxin Xre/MbcA/ParS toxin-binding domain-containing protein [unclassified Thioalkalivibrio]